MMKYLFKSRLSIFDVVSLGLLGAFAPLWLFAVLFLPLVVFSTLMEDHL